MLVFSYSLKEFSERLRSIGYMGRLKFREGEGFVYSYIVDSK